MSTLKEYTLEGWIDAFRSELNTNPNFSLLIAKSDGTNTTFMADESVLSKYTAELEPFIETVEMTPREQQYYAYNPRLLSYDMYGAPEFWYLILLANEMHSELEFTPKRLRFYNAGVMNVLNAIRILEEPRLDDNRQEMDDVVVNHTEINNNISPII